MNQKILIIVCLSTLVFSGCINEGETTTTTMRACYGEGERFNTLETQNAVCCGGLTRAVDSFPDEPVGRPDSCVTPTCPCYVCIDCGNGVCGKEENWCNCPKDCPIPEEIPCVKDNDCGESFCSQGRNKCQEIKYYCGDGECQHSRKEYENYTCVGNKCEDTCGNGICDPGETRWWCDDCP